MLLSGISPLLFLYCLWLQVSETLRRQGMGEGGMTTLREAPCYGLWLSRAAASATVIPFHFHLTPPCESHSERNISILPTQHTWERNQEDTAFGKQSPNSPAAPYSGILNLILNLEASSAFLLDPGFLHGLRFLCPPCIFFACYVLSS